MFIARVRGHSMEPRIKDGSWNHFRLCPKGTRDGLIVLVQFKSRGDLENGGRFTVKKYRFVRKVTEDDWNHEHIELLPLNRNYDSIIVTPHESPGITFLNTASRISWLMQSLTHAWPR